MCPSNVAGTRVQRLSPHLLMLFSGFFGSCDSPVCLSSAPPPALLTFVAEIYRVYLRCTAERNSVNDSVLRPFYEANFYESHLLK